MKPQYNQKRSYTMKKILLAFCLSTGALFAQQAPPQAQLTPLMSKDLTDIPGKEVMMATVVSPPGEVDHIHRHNAHVFVLAGPGASDPIHRHNANVFVHVLRSRTWAEWVATSGMHANPYLPQ
jgi:hypothetical protein